MDKEEYAKRREYEKNKAIYNQIELENRMSHLSSMIETFNLTDQTITDTLGNNIQVLAHRLDRLNNLIRNLEEDQKLNKIEPYRT